MKLRFLTFIFLLAIVGSIKAQKPDSISVVTADTVVSASDSSVMAFLAELNIPVTNNNKIKLLKSGKEKFDDLFAAIRKAKHHIHLEYFNFRNDSIANVLFDLLAVKAEEGVEVRAIFDAFGNWSNSRPLKKKHLIAIRERGIEIVHFDPLLFPYINHALHRDHRKIAVIDGTIAYTGGINIADYYIKGLPKIGVWRDMHIRLEGDAVRYLQEIFLTIWNKTTKQKVEGDQYFPEPVFTLEQSDKAIAIVDREPRKTPKQIRHTYAKSICCAQEKIQIVNPYFLPTRSIKKELKKAIDRGIKVEIMISAKADIGFTPEASLYYANLLRKRGASIYIYNGGFHHSKIMMVDESFCTIGTANLNSRSLRYDYEVNAFIFNEETTDELGDIFEADKSKCTLLTTEKWKERSKWKRFVGWFATLFTPVL